MIVWIRGGPFEKKLIIRVVTLTGSRFGDKFKVETNMGNTPISHYERTYLKRELMALGLLKMIGLYQKTHII